MKVCLVFPVFPPSIDGIGDHTSRLAGALAEDAEVLVLTGPKPHDSFPGVQTVAVFGEDPRESARRLVKTISVTDPDWVLVQYNPFSYGKWGYNPFLPQAVKEIAGSRRRVALMIHEPSVPPESLRFRIMRLWQQRQLNSLIESASLVFFSISAWTREFSKLYPGKRIVHLPIGSNIPLVSQHRFQVRKMYGVEDDAILLGLFGSGHPNRLFGFVRAAVETLRASGLTAPLLYVGGSSSRLGEALGELDFHDAGKLPPEDVSHHLGAMDVYLCPFKKGVSSRRGSFMAGIQHGLPCVTTTGSQTDDFFLEYNGNAFVASSDSSTDDFCRNVRKVMEDSSLRNRLGEGGRRLYAERFEWEALAARAKNAMAGLE